MTHSPTPILPHPFFHTHPFHDLSSHTHSPIPPILPPTHSPTPILPYPFSHTHSPIPILPHPSFHQEEESEEEEEEGEDDEITSPTPPKASDTPYQRLCRLSVTGGKVTSGKVTGGNAPSTEGRTSRETSRKPPRNVYEFVTPWQRAAPGRAVRAEEESTQEESTQEQPSSSHQPSHPRAHPPSHPPTQEQEEQDEVAPDKQGKRPLQYYENPPPKKALTPLETQLVEDLKADKRWLIKKKERERQAWSKKGKFKREPCYSAKLLKHVDVVELANAIVATEEEGRLQSYTTSSSWRCVAVCAMAAHLLHDRGEAKGGRWNDHETPDVPGGVPLHSYRAFKALMYKMGDPQDDDDGPYMKVMRICMELARLAVKIPRFLELRTTRYHPTPSHPIPSHPPTHLTPSSQLPILPSTHSPKTTHSPNPPILP